MSYNHIDVAAVLESLGEAKSAYEAVPGLRQRIDELEAALADRDRTIRNTSHDLEETMTAKAQVEAKLQATEVERDQYFFRAEEAADKLSKMASVLGVAASPEPVTQAPPKTEVPEPAAAPSPAIPEDREGDVTSNPTSATATTSDTSSGTVPLALVESANTGGDRPYLGKPYYERPSGMSWQEWSEKGGERPYWVTQQDVA